MPMTSDYMSMLSNLDLNRGSGRNLRDLIERNEVSAFWDGIQSNQYGLQSVQKPFDGTGSRNAKISAFTVHDTEMFVVNGTKSGWFGVTNFSQHPIDSLAVRVHQERVTDIRTTVQRPLHVYTSSYDGCIKVLDLTRIPTFQAGRNRGLFGDAVVDNDDVKIHGFDVKNAGREILGVDDQGMLIHCDLRTHSTFVYQLAERKIATIRVNPVNEKFFGITESRHKSLQLWDFRKIGADLKEPVHRRTFAKVQNAINFSSDGSALLAAGRDDFVRVFHDPMHSFYRDEVKVQHWNQTGIWISDFKPVFHPKYAEVVLTGSLRQKGIDVLYLGRDGQTKCRNIHDLERVKGVHSFGAFHPKFDDYLFGVTYEKLVFYARIPDADVADFD